MNFLLAFDLKLKNALGMKIGHFVIHKTHDQ